MKYMQNCGKNTVREIMKNASSKIKANMAIDLSRIKNKTWEEIMNMTLEEINNINFDKCD